MKLCLVYDPNDNKLRPDAYSCCYRRMLLKLAHLSKWEQVQHVTKSCSAADIDADVIVFWDIHSTHDVTIAGIRNHKAVKYSFLDDPWQVDHSGIDGYGRKFHKLGARIRLQRELNRSVDFIISPCRETYYQFFAAHLGHERAEKMLLWQPTVPDVELFTMSDWQVPLENRLAKILGNGATHDQYGFYDFRRWVLRQPYVYHVRHHIAAKDTPAGEDYAKLLVRFSGAVAACADVAVPKYLEMPLAGCVTFAQWNRDYYDMGFRDFENCIYIDRMNMEKRMRAFLKSPSAYQPIANAGRKLVQSKYTADHFAEAIYRHAESRVKG